MKKFRKIMAVLVAAMMIAVMVTPMMGTKVWADSDYKITVSGALQGETYKAYKIFDLTDDVAAGGNTTWVSASSDGTAKTGEHYYERSTDSNTGEKIYTDITSSLTVGTSSVSTYYKLRKGVAYTISSTNPFYTNIFASGYTGMHFDASAGDPTKIVVTFDEGTFNPANLAATLKAAIEADIAATEADDQRPLVYASYLKDTKPTTPGTGNGTTTASVVLDVGSAGYYFVNTTLGSFAALDSASKEITMYEKNTAPSLVKKISETGADNSYGAGPISIDIGDTAHYEIVITAGKGMNQDIVVHDTIEGGLTLCDAASFTAKDKNGADVAFTFEDDPGDTCSFELVFAAGVVDDLAQQ